MPTYNEQLQLYCKVKFKNYSKVALSINKHQIAIKVAGKNPQTVKYYIKTSDVGEAIFTRPRQGQWQN